MKLLLLLAMTGHILCGITDCLFTYGPKGKVDLTALGDYEKAQSAFEGMVLKNPIVGIILDAFALTMAFFGYVGMADWMSGFSKPGATIMYVFSIVYFLFFVSHHVTCGTVEWFFVRLGRSREALFGGLFVVVM